MGLTLYLGKIDNVNKPRVGNSMIQKNKTGECTCDCQATVGGDRSREDLSEEIIFELKIE